MTGRDVFAGDRPRWLRLATVLTGDPARARTLLAQATLRRPSRPDPRAARASAGSDPLDADRPADEVARQTLFDTYLGPRLGWAEAVPADHHDPRWDELSRRQRAGLALVCFENLTETEAAKVLNLGQPAVHADLRQALSRLGFPAGRAGYDEVGVLLRSRADDAPDPVGLGGEVRRQRAARRRLRTRVLAGAVALVVVIAGVVVLPDAIRHRLPVSARDPGALLLQHEVDPPKDWQVAFHQVGPEHDSTVFSGTGRPGWMSVDPGSTLCMVSTFARGITPPQPGSDDGDSESGEQRLRDPEQVRIHGHEGELGTANTGETYLTWEFAPDGYARVMCSPDIARRDVVALAKDVHFRQNPVLVPFRWSGSDVETTVDAVMVTGAEVFVGATLGAQEPPSTEAPAQIAVSLDTAGTTRNPDGHPDEEVFEDPSGSVCRQREGATLCASLQVPPGQDSGDPDNAADRHAHGIDEVRDLISDSELADVADPDTWFDAREAFGDQ